MTEIDNVNVFRDTQRQTREKYPPNMDGVRYYNRLQNITPTLPRTPIIMVHGGTVSTGYAYADDMRVAILNFADAVKFGGWVEYGAQTQEENICRCTNIYPVLGSESSNEHYYKPNRETLVDRPADDYFHYGNSDEIYTDRIIYARDITVFKDDSTYENIEPKQLDVITCPAPSASLRPRDASSIFISRIAQVVLSAIANGAECIVLGAWGCGAFCQDPEIVARAFARVLNFYGGYFKKIVFAIKPTPSWKEKDVYSIFKNTLSEFYDGEVN